MLKLISLNIEGDNHYDKIFPFFKKENPDVICLQEMWEVDIPMFEEKLGMKGTHISMASITQPNPYRLAQKGNWGIALFTKLPVTTSAVLYKGEPNTVPDFVIGEPNSVNRYVLFADVEKDGQVYHLAMTHFTWADDGGTNEDQQKDIHTLFSVLDSHFELILTGDFNSPRGGEIFSLLAEKFTDNIPQDVQTTIDNDLHRVGDTLRPLVVDHLFTTPQYSAHDVRVVSGVSDHMAIVAEIEKK